MPQLQIRGRNKPPVPDGVPGFGGGQVSNLRPSLLQTNQSEGLQNVDLVRLEDATTRRGCDQLETGETTGPNAVLGMGFFKVGATEKLVRVKNTGTLKVQTHDGTPASSWTDAAGWTPSAANCDLVQGNDKMFFANGTDNLRSWDGAAFTDMGTGYPAPPKYAHILYATNRLIGWGDTANPDTLGFSNILGEGVWSLANTMRIGAGDGDEIVTCVLWTKTLLAVFKRTSCYVVNIDPSAVISTMTIETVSETIGCVGPRAACKVGKDIWFMTDEGVRSLTRVLNGEDTEVVPPISFPVHDVIDTINKAALGTVCCYFYGDRFFIAIPTGVATLPDKVLPALVISAEPRWLGTWTGWAPVIFVRSKFGRQKKLNIGRSDGRVWRWRDFVTEASEVGGDFQDAGTEIATHILSRRLNFGDGDAWKQGFAVELEFNLSTANVSLYAVPDGSPASTPLLTASSAIGTLSFPISFPLVFPAVGIKRTPGTLMHSGRFREIAFLVASTAGKLALRKLSASAFMQSMEVRST
jgi:hypothetical protein